jgi:hypothetical protein
MHTWWQISKNRKHLFYIVIVPEKRLYGYFAAVFFAHFEKGIKKAPVETGAAYQN